MRKGRDGEWNGKWNGNNGENSGPLKSLPVDRLTATDCNTAARANLDSGKKMLDFLQSYSIILEISEHFPKSTSLLVF